MSKNFCKGKGCRWRHQYHLRKLGAAIGGQSKYRCPLICHNFIKKNMIDPTMITNSFELNGYRITRTLGVVRGITVRSRSLLGNIAGGLQSIFGGRLSVYVDLCEKTREEAFQHMIDHANERGANAVINMRYDANEVMDGITEVLAYGTAVMVEKS
jgi:uncharacterized protein YbjQ (UPF0145 family)